MKSEILVVMDSTLEATAFGLSAQVNPADSSASSNVSFTLLIRADEVHFTPENGRQVASLEFVFAQFGPDGSRLNMTEQPLGLKLTQPAYDDILRQGLIFTKTMNVVPNAEVLKVVAVDRSTGGIGSLLIPLTR